MRIGMGYDVHKLVEGRKLIIGGVEIPHETGLLGHSDAYVLLHAIMDALLGAAALGDIGLHFPDSDPTYKGCDSMKLYGLGKADVACPVIIPSALDAQTVAKQAQHQAAHTIALLQPDRGAGMMLGLIAEDFRKALVDQKIARIGQYGGL